jgi:hypothetical protein
MKRRILPIRLRLGVIRAVAGVDHIRNISACDSSRADWMHEFNRVSTHCLPNDAGWPRAAERLPECVPEPAQVPAHTNGNSTDQH